MVTFLLCLGLYGLIGYLWILANTSLIEEVAKDLVKARPEFANAEGLLIAFMKTGCVVVWLVLVGVFLYGLFKVSINSLLRKK